MTGPPGAALASVGPLGSLRAGGLESSARLATRPAPMSIRASLPALLLAGIAACGGGQSPPRTVVLISLDTLRPERLGVYGNAPDVSPNVDRFAHDAVVFDHALSNAPWTLPSHMTILTGLDPVAHGVVSGNLRLTSHLHTLAESLKEAGFDTGAFTDGGFVDHIYGFDRGFDVYRDERSPDGPNGFRRILPEALEWMRRRGDHDYFVFLHTFDAHAPYGHAADEVLEQFRARPTPPGPLDAALYAAHYLHQQDALGIGRYERMSALLNDYDSGVHQADLGVGQILDVLQQTGRYDDALVILLSDHGETFLDHRLYVGHGVCVTNAELSVPLIVKLPRSREAGRRIDTLVDLVDVTPTALDYAHVDGDPNIQGESLIGLIERGEHHRDYAFGGTVNSETYYLVRDGYKYITPIGIPPMLVAERHLGPDTPPLLAPYALGMPYTIGQGEDQVTLHYNEHRDPLGMLDLLPSGAQLYRLADDPQEHHNLVDEEPEVAARMTAELRDELLSSRAIAQALLDEEAPRDTNPHELHQLAQLGYLTTHSKKDYASMSKPMREELAEPIVAPDMGPMWAADSRVHALRLLVQAGRPLPSDAAATLQSCGGQYMAWAREHHEQRTRSQWRLLELDELAHRAGLELDTSAWRELMTEKASAKKKEKDKEKERKQAKPQGTEGGR